MDVKCPGELCCHPYVLSFAFNFCVLHALKSELEFEHCWPILSDIFVVLDNCIIHQMKYFVGERLWLLVDYMGVQVLMNNEETFVVFEG
jgi:hypothetical protein